jgi:hypothetical protein
VYAGSIPTPASIPAIVSSSAVQALCPSSYPSILNVCMVIAIVLTLIISI